MNDLGMTLVARPSLHGKFCTVGILVGTGSRQGENSYCLFDKVFFSEKSDPKLGSLTAKNFVLNLLEVTLLGKIDLDKAKFLCGFVRINTIVFCKLKLRTSTPQWHFAFGGENCIRTDEEQFWFTSGFATVS